MHKIYLIRLAVIGLLAVFLSCSDDDATDPMAEFTTMENPAYTHEVQFINKSKRATSYLWNFGNYIESTEESPKHLYRWGGEYFIKLIAYDSISGRSDTLNRRIVVQWMDACSHVKQREDVQTIDDYIALNYIKNVVEHSSGLRYIIHQEGTGPKPTANSVVNINFRLQEMFSQGTIDSGNINDKLSNLLGGLQTGLPLLPAGSRATFYMTSCMGYGKERIRDLLRPYELLVCYVELLDVQN